MKIDPCCNAPAENGNACVLSAVHTSRDAEHHAFPVGYENRSKAIPAGAPTLNPDLIMDALDDAILELQWAKIEAGKGYELEAADHLTRASVELMRAWDPPSRNWGSR